MRFHIGSRVTIDRTRAQYGVVSEIVPPHAAPRTVRHTAGWRRPIESYVVTVLTPRTVRIRGEVRSTAASIGCQRIWPSPDTLRPRDTAAW